MLSVFLSSLFAENLALAYFLGICTFLAVSKTVEAAVGLGITMIGIMTITVPLNQVLYTYVLQPGALARFGFGQTDLSFLVLVTGISIIAATVQITEMVLLRYGLRLYEALGIFLPLLTVNCAILGASLFMIERHYTFAESIAFGFGGGCGWALAIIVFAAIRERLRYSFVPEGLRGLGLAFMVTGMLSLVFSALGGV